ncbi:MAG: type II toxin-antitoxin system VapC family toxin [Deinococcus sp.]|nr:type II toxin-antitoxin system VapC family toxin [Deinococcus sp.]
MTSIDTNVLVTLLKADRPGHIQTAQAALEQASQLGTLVISPVVYAELFAMPLRDEAFLNHFLQDTRINVEWRMTRAMWHRAALAYGTYAERRRGRKGDPGPRRILADFLIGAHASELGARFLTFDSGVYKSAFPELELVLL